MVSRSWSQAVLLAWLFSVFSHAVASSELGRRAATCSAGSTDLLTLKQNVADPVTFCNWWGFRARESSPFAALSPSKVGAVCTCVRSNPNIVGTKAVLTPANPSPGNQNILKLEKAVKSPLAFCSFWLGVPYTRDQNPFTGLDYKAVSTACKSITATPSLVVKPTISSSKSTSSAKITSTAKAASKSSVSAAKTSSKTSSIQKTSSKVSSSSKSSTSLSSSSKKTSGMISSSQKSFSASSTLKTSSAGPRSSSSAFSSSSKPTTSSSRPSSVASSTKTASSLISSSSAVSRSSSSFTSSAVFGSSSSSSSSSTKASSSMTRVTKLHSSVSASACGSQATNTLTPKVDPAVDTSRVSNLEVSNNITVGYSLAYDLSGDVSANVTFDTVYPAIALEHSSLISNIKCSEYYITFGAQNNDAFDAINAWPKNQSLALVTFQNGCNPSTERGVYIAGSWSSDASSLGFTFRVRNATWAEVAETMHVTYGTRSNSACTTGNPSPTAKIPNYTDRPNYEDLSAPAREIVDYLKDRLQYDSNGFIKLSVPDQTNATLAEQDYQPNNATEQAALADALTAAGLDGPEDMIAAAKKSISGICYSNANNSSPSNTTASPDMTANAPLRLKKRDGWDTAWDIGCSDLVGAFTGDVGEAVCGAKDIYDSRDAIACMFTGCWSKVPDPTYVYSFDWSGYASFFFPQNSDVVSWTDGSALRCVDCSYSISEMKIVGQISAVLATGEIKGASITFKETSKANMFFDLTAKRPINYDWSSSLSTSNLQSVVVDGVFNINPTLIFNMGAQFSTDKAIHITAGSSLTTNGATADIDLGTAAVSNVGGWTPETNFQNPALNKQAKVELYPYMRRVMKINFSVMGNKISNTAVITSQTSLGFVGQTDSEASYCPENQMLLQTYLSAKQALVFDNGYTKLLYSDSSNKGKQCFDVPSDIPTRAEVSSLAEVGSDFCTAYIGYRAPYSGLFTAATTTVPSISTYTSTSSVTTTPTVFTSVEATFTKTRTILTEAYTAEAAAGSQALATDFLKRDVTYEAMPTRPADFDLRRRALVTPAVAAGWDSSKLSYACSQIATGTSTYTVITGTNTVTSGVSTTTETISTLVGAPAFTSTSTNSHYTFYTSTSTTDTISTPTSCPLQSQVSCFTLTGHGSSYIEGQKLNVRKGLANPVFDNTGSSFYLTCDGKLVSLPDMTILTSVDGGSNPGMTFLDEWASNSSDVAACKKDTNTGQISCSTGGSNLMYAWEPEDPYWLKSYWNVAAFQDTRVAMPSWSKLTSDTYSPIYLTYEETTCPCADARTEDFTVLDTSVPSCPQADGTTYTASDGTNYQVQCNTDYTGNDDSTTTTSSLASCLATCQAKMLCVAATWTPSSNTCTLKTNAVSVGTVDPSNPIHSVIKLGQRPKLFLFTSSGDQSLYVGRAGDGAVQFTKDSSAAHPFYFDDAGVPHSWRDPSWTLLDRYQPDGNTADSKVYIEAPSSNNYAITCSQRANTAGAYYGGCQAAGTPDGNPVVYAWGWCPSTQGLYMIPNYSNVHCSGGYAFAGFFLVAYTGT